MHCPDCGSKEHEGCIQTERDNWWDALVDAVHDLDLRGHWVNNGIGPYEYWGARGVDVQMDFEVEEEKAITIEWIDGPEEPDDQPSRRLSMEKTVWFGKHDDQSVDVEVTVELQEYEAKLVGRVYKHRATYLVAGP